METVRSSLHRSLTFTLLVFWCVAATGEELRLTESRTPIPVSLLIAPARAAGGTIALRSHETGTMTTRAVDANRVAALRRLLIAPGSYDLIITLDGHRPASREIDARDGAPLALGTIGVSRAPVIRGSIRTSPNGSPPTGARVTWEPSGAVAVEASGHFALTMTHGWPSHLLISAPGYGTKWIPVMAVEADLNLPPVDLTRGGTVRARIQRGGIDDPLEVQLGVERDDEAPLWIARRRLDERQSEAVFTDVERGVYVIRLRGRDPLEQLTTKVVLGTGDTRTIELKPTLAFVRGKVRLGGKPLENAEMRFTHHDSHWSGVVRTNEQGEIHSAIWEQGRFAYDIRTAPSRAPHAGQLVLEGKPLQPILSFEIDVPDRIVKGRVVDPHGGPAQAATVSLRTQRADGVASTVRTSTDQTGAFEFGGVPAGLQTLRTGAPDALASPPITFQMAESDSLYEREIALRAGYLRPLKVIHADGVAAADATVLCVADGVVRSGAITQSDGQASIPTPEEGAAVLYVIPREGSLLIARLAPPAEDAGGVLRLVIPPGSATLRVVAKAIDGSRMPNLSLLVRYNGELIPPQVAKRIESVQGQILATNDAGEIMLAHIPSGTYEMWPYASEADAESLMQTASAGAAPVVVNVVTGENEVVVRFRKSR